MILRYRLAKNSIHLSLDTISKDKTMSTDKKTKDKPAISMSELKDTIKTKQPIVPNRISHANPTIKVIANMNQDKGIKTRQKKVHIIMKVSTKTGTIEIENSTLRNMINPMYQGIAETTLKKITITLPKNTKKDVHTQDKTNDNRGITNIIGKIIKVNNIRL